MGGASQESAQPIILSQHGTIIGLFPEVDFKEQTNDLPAFSRLYVFSDGIYEITRPDGTILTYEEFVQILSENRLSPQPVLESTLNAIRGVRGGNQFEDDVSIVEFAL
jgi:sigma-B regulation protein RsbU (phosphoserine phosphatase)